MNISTKCNCCLAENVCKFKEQYNQARKEIADIAKGYGLSIVEVIIKCPNRIEKSLNGVNDYCSTFGTPGDSIALQDFLDMQHRKEINTMTEPVN